MAFDQELIIKSSAIFTQTIPIFGGVTIVATLGWVLSYCYYGIDFTDEGFYLAWISNPSIYSVSLTQFGFVFNPLYVLVDGNIAVLRQVNILTTYLLALLLCNLLLSTIFERSSLDRGLQLMISGAIATSTLVRLVHLSTPNYNSLALQALLIVAIGILLAEKVASKKSLVGWFLIGLGGWLSFMAKPSTAAALAICILFYLPLAGKFRARMFCIPILTSLGLLVISALLIDGSIQGFAERLKGGVEVAFLIGDSRYSEQLLRLDKLRLTRESQLWLVVGTLYILIAIYFSLSQKRALALLGTLLVFVLVVFSLVVIFEVITRPIGRLQPQVLWAITLSALITSLSIYRLKGLSQIPIHHWYLALIFLMFPYIYAFGSSNNLWNQGSKVAIFWIFSGLIFLRPIVSAKNLAAILIPLGLATQLLSILLIHASYDRPYRQPQPLRTNELSIEVGAPGSVLVLTKGYGRYIQEAVNLALIAGFKKKTPVIDLTGKSPGLLYAIDASNIGQAWTIGGYSGSDKLATTMLGRVSCNELAAAWLLTEPGGPNEISPDIITSFGADPVTDFQVVGTFFTPRGAGGRKQIREQKLLRPNRSDNKAEADCLATRQG